MKFSGATTVHPNFHYENTVKIAIIDPATAGEIIDLPCVKTVIVCFYPMTLPAWQNCKMSDLLSK
jgi:hypothetical protein